MSKTVVSVPERLLRYGMIGALISLVSYVGLQFLGALLIHYEVMGEGMIYPLVCFSAALSSFLGCGYSVMRGGSGSILSASTVALVFLSLTIAIGFVSGEASSVGAGMVGVGGAMVLGGLCAAVLLGLKREGHNRDRSRVKRKRR